jgi:platelet-activating factor acetylhydrolase
MVVIALDHRDGSSPIQYVRATDGSEARIIDPVKISHDPSPEVYQGRDKQLRIRLWEISAAYEALMKIDQGQRLENLDINASTNRKERVEVLAQFDGMMDIHRAGKVTFAGHSYGACTAVQLVKSIFYHKERPKDAGIPLISPNVDAAIAHQIMPESPMLLLDMWGLPFKSPDQAYLWDKPLPSHAVGGPEGSNVISILSEAFHNWDANTTINKHIVAAPSLSRRPSTAPRLSREPGQLLPSWAHLARDESPSMDSGYASNSPLRAPARSHSKSADHSQTSAQQSRDGSQKSRSTSSDSANPIHRLPGPHMFYVKQSQHFNQSDFGLLFPWIAKRVTKAEDPERIMELNARAMAQVLRQSGIDVAGEDDPEILDKNSKVPRWTYIPVEEEESTVGTGAIARKLSVVSSKSAPSPRDGMTMGMKTDAQLPKLDLPEAAQS